MPYTCEMNWSYIVLILIFLKIAEPVSAGCPYVQNLWTGSDRSLIFGIRRSSFESLGFCSGWWGLASSTTQRKVLQRNEIAGPDKQANRMKRGVEKTRSSDFAKKAFAEATRLRAEWNKAALIAAIAKYEKARAYWQAAGDEQETLALNGIGEAYKILGQNQKAIDFYNLALRLAETRSDRKLQIETLNFIANLYVDLGESQKTADYSARALVLSRTYAWRRGEAHAFNNLGLASYGSGDMQKAFEYFEQALVLFQEEQDNQGQAEALKNIGDIYTNWGDLQKSLAFYNRALALWPIVGDRRGERLTMTSLAVVYMLTGEMQKALDLDKNARRFFAELGDRVSEAVALNGIGYIYNELGKKRESLAFYAQAVKIYRELGNPIYEAHILGQIGEVLTELGETPKALANFNRKLEISRAIKDQRMEAYTLKDMGTLSYAFGDLEKALDYYRQALVLSRAVSDKRGEIYALNNIGRVYYKRGEKQKALDNYEAALKLVQAAADRRAESVTLHHIAQVMRDQGRLEGARKMLEELLSLTESLRNAVVSREMRASYFASFREHYELYIDVLMQLHKRNPAQKLSSIAVATSERARARSLLETLAEAHVDIRRGVAPAMLDRERILQQLLNAKAERLVRLASGKHTDQELALLRQEIADLTVQYQEIGAEIRAASPNYATLTQPGPLAVDEIQQQVLDSDTLLLEYALGDERSYLWAVSKSSLESFELAGRTEIEQAAKRFYELLTTHNRRRAGESANQRDARLQQVARDYQQAASRLSRMILGPAASQLGAKRLVIVADGALQFVPFAALPDPVIDPSASESLPLIANHEIINLPSASALAVLREEVTHQKAPTKTLAVLADPVFEVDDVRVKSGRGPSSKRLSRVNIPVRSIDEFVASGESLRFERLPFAAQEAQEVIRFVPEGERKLATGFAASRAAAMDPDLGKYRIIHFATHGMLDSLHPDLSSIVLSLVDERGKLQDGYLRLNEIYNLKLSADMVVLSACQTALGKEIRGEGLVGLTRGFMYAGAARVVASLWKVDDRASAEIMKHFYENMFSRKMRPAAALRAAQLEMMKQERWKSPYYWAGFVLQGEWR